MTSATTPDLASYDVLLVNTSGGKDSQTALHVVCRLAAALGISDRVVAVHADLGRVEWEGTRQLAAEQANFYGVPFRAISRPQGDLLQQIEDRGKFPSSTARYCTSDHKRGQVSKVHTALAREHAAALADAGEQPRPCRILNIMGLRAAESPARARKVEFEHDQRASNGRRHVDTWLPILAWSDEEVWASIRYTGVAYHPAYDQGMPRLSCSFCVLASRSALVRAAQLRPALAQEYRELEVRIGHTIQSGTSMADIIEEAQRTPAAAVAGWSA